MGGRLGIPFECDTVGVADVTIGADMDDQGRDVFRDQLMLLEVVPQRPFQFRAQPPLPRQTQAESGDQQIEPGGDQAVVQRIVLPAGQKLDRVACHGHHQWHAGDPPIADAPRRPVRDSAPFEASARRLREIAGEQQIRSDVATGKLVRVRRSQQNLAVVAVKRHCATLPHVQ